MYVLTAKEMQSIDHYTIQNLGISQEILMEKAALCAVEEIMKLYPHNVICVCGNGNNGGDGIAVARILKMKGIRAAVYLCSDITLCKPSVQKQLSLFERIGGVVINEPDFNDYDVIVDAIFGIGLSRNICEPFASVIQNIATASAKESTKVISLDIPSGINTDTGAVMNVAVKADITIAFAYAKRGHLLYPGRSYCGELLIKDAGMYLDYSELKDRIIGTFFANPKECKLPVTKITANKGTQGRILVIAGSDSMYGACYLSSAAAFYMGCGLVDIYTTSDNIRMLKTILPEAIYYCMDSECQNFDVLKTLTERASCVIIGPGLSTSGFAHDLVTFTLNNCHKPIVLDADAINCIADNTNAFYQILNNRNTPVIMTPHPKELSRFLQKDCEEVLSDYTEYLTSTARAQQLIIVGKGASSVITDGIRFHINTSGNEGMATAGSGDVLTGIIAGLIARGEPPYDAACKGVYLHGLSGDIMSERKSKTSLMAHDLLDGISEINLKYENKISETTGGLL